MSAPSPVSTSGWRCLRSVSLSPSPTSIAGRRSVKARALRDDRPQTGSGIVGSAGQNVVMPSRAMPRPRGGCWVHEERPRLWGARLSPSWAADPRTMSVFVKEHLRRRLLARGGFAQAALHMGSGIVRLGLSPSHSADREHGDVSRWPASTWDSYWRLSPSAGG